MKRIKEFLKENKGASEVTQSFLLIGVALALVLTVFFPKVKTSFESMAINLDTWMTTTASTIFSIQ